MGQFPEDYYALPGAAQALAARLGAIRQVLPRDSRILDLGCNDARISRALLDSGHAVQAICYDHRPPSASGHPALELRCADLLTLDPAALPAADAVLLLNVTHHLLVRGAGFVQRLVAQLLARAPVVLVDMGSLTEPDQWPWRHLMGQLWPSDHAMWNEIFSAARWRRVLATYPFQGGRRTLFKLVGPLEPTYRYRRLATYRRTNANRPQDKRLFEVHGEDDQPIPFGPGIGDLCPDVVFHLLQREETEERFWAKSYRGPQAHPDRLRVEEEVQRFVRTQPFAASTWLEVSAEHGFCLGSLEENGLLDGVGRPPAESVEIVGEIGGPVEVGVGDLDRTGDQRFEGGPEVGHPGDGQGTHGGAVVGDVAADDLLAQGLAGDSEVLADELPGRLDGLGATGGEEDAVAVTRRQVGQAVGQLDGGGVGVAPYGKVGQGAGLPGGRFGQLGPTVAHLAGEQSGQTVEVPLAV